ncbi:hypothetical protein H0B56_01870 [Haloechinothrix sp. YIM 98757]|uniref:Lipoprotein LpqN n=1 Tax=Haloechinothrix aidingensis TaxID=2752311 RepID=A0A837ZZP4_9PSEU|nr:hypothetical protein [Haloechinothrix aidingensis]MBA0124283.1 hypothetical protein [Haloechinothrix aidingensis]
MRVPARVVVASVASAALLAGCGADEVPGKPEAAEDGAGSPGDGVAVHEGAVDVLVEMPPGWRIRPEAAQGATVIANAEACGQDFCDNVNVLLDAAHGATAEEFHDVSLTELDGIGELESEREVDVDGRTGYEVEYAGDLGMGQGDMRYLVRYTVVDDQAVIVTYTARPDTFDEWRADAEAMLESIEIRQP